MKGTTTISLKINTRDLSRLKVWAKENGSDWREVIATIIEYIPMTEIDLMFKESEEKFGEMLTDRLAANTGNYCGKLIMDKDMFPRKLKKV